MLKKSERILPGKEVSFYFEQSDKLCMIFAYIQIAQF